MTLTMMMNITQLRVLVSGYSLKNGSQFDFWTSKMFFFQNRLTRLTDEDFRKAEDFVQFMQVLYTSTLSTEKSPTCGKILPILQKLK